MAGLRAQNENETEGDLISEEEHESPKIHPKHPSNLQLKEMTTDGENEQMSVTDHLTLSTFMFSPGRAEDEEVPHKVTCAGRHLIIS